MPKLTPNIRNKQIEKKKVTNRKNNNKKHHKQLDKTANRNKN